MKKFWILIILVIAVVGCNNKTNVKKVDNTYSIKYNDDYYSIFMPYKEGVGNNYILNSNVVDFDMDTIEKELIQISTTKFSVDKYYYQEGQYLTRKNLSELLDDEHLNEFDKEKIDGKNVKPVVVSGIIEKNFLNKSGDIKGISIGIILNKYQKYDSNNNYVEMDNDRVIKIGKSAGKQVIKYLRKEKKLDDVPILVALYIESSPKSNIGGTYYYYGITDNEDISYESINQKKFYMNNQNVKKMNLESYNNFRSFEEKVKNYDNTIYVSGLGNFEKDNLERLEIVVTKNHYTYGDLLYVNQLLSDNSIKYFDDTKVVIKVKAVNDIKSYIVKEKGQTSTDIFIY